jgi:hypothetical protein
LHYLEVHHVGPSRAIPRTQLEAIFGLDPEDEVMDRAFRHMYSVVLGIPVCEHGLYVPRNLQDVEQCRLYLWPKMSPDRHRARMERVYAAFPKCRPEQGTQLELGMEAPR